MIVHWSFVTLLGEECPIQPDNIPLLLCYSSFRSLSIGCTGTAHGVKSKSLPIE